MENVIVNEVTTNEVVTEIVNEVADTEIVTTLKKCKACGKMLKKNAESTLCKKCTSSKMTEIIEEEVKIITEEIVAEITVTEIIEEPQPTPEPAKVEVTIKPGQLIREKFQQLINDGKITDEIFLKIITKEGTNELFKFNFAFLLKYDGTQSVKEQASIKGHIRFSSKIWTINGSEYLLSNDIYERSVKPFMKWCEEIEKTN